MENNRVVSYDINKKPIYENETIVEFLDDKDNKIQGFFKYNSTLFRYELFVSNDSHYNHFYIMKGIEKLIIIGKH